MKQGPSPQQKKTRFYHKDHHVLAEYPHSFARMWPRKKARANRKYRRQVGQILTKRARQDKQDDHDARLNRLFSIRRDIVRKWEPPMSMREWVTSRLEQRVRRMAWNYFKHPYDRVRHRARFIGFLKEITAGHSEHSRHLARYLNELLEPPEPVRSSPPSPWNFPWAHVWLSAFFSDEPEWEGRLRTWIRDLLL